MRRELSTPDRFGNPGATVSGDKIGLKFDFSALNVALRVLIFVNYLKRKFKFPNELFLYEFCLIRLNFSIFLAQERFGKAFKIQV